jgi:hypothetical protein
MDQNERTRKPLDERIANACAIAAGILGALLAFYYGQFLFGAVPGSPPEGLIAAWATSVALLALVKIVHCVADRVGRRHAKQVQAEIAAEREDIANLRKEVTAALDTLGGQALQAAELISRLERVATDLRRNTPSDDTIANVVDMMNHRSGSGNVLR